MVDPLFETKAIITIQTMIELAQITNNDVEIIQTLTHRIVVALRAMLEPEVSPLSEQLYFHRP